MKRLIVAVVILAGLIVYLRWPSKKVQPAAAASLVKFDPGQVTRIQVDQAGQPEVILDKTGDKWQVAQPYATGADEGTVTTLLTTASTIDPAEKLGAEQNLAPFGLDAPATVQVGLKDGQKFGFQFGATTPTGDNLYLKLANAPVVYTVPTYVKSDMVKTVFDLQDKSLLHFTSDQVNSVAMTYQGKKYGFARVKGQWPSAEADNIQALTDALANAQMDAMADASGKDAASYGLAHPATVVALTWNGGQGTLEVGNKKGTSEYYARSSESPAIFTINSYLLDDVTTLAQPPKKPPVVTAAPAAKAPAAQPPSKKPPTGGKTTQSS